MSDAYASALWAADFALRAATAGFSGINFHGGGVGVYTPIESSIAAPARPRPVYYGLEFAQMFASSAIARCLLDTNANVTAYQADRGGKTTLAFVNKGETPIIMQLPENFIHGARIQRYDLRGPSLSAKTGVKFGPTPYASGVSTAQIPAWSAAILRQS